MSDPGGDTMTIELTDRAARPARPRRGRHAMTGTVALLVLAVSLSDLSGVRRPAATPTADVGPVPASSPAPPPPAPAPPVPSTVPPRATTSAVTPVGPPKALGRLFYVPDGKVAGRERVRLRSWRPGERPRTLAVLPRIAALANASVSPDGRRVAWVDPARAATLFVADVDGSRRRTLARHVDAYCVTPTWSPDSRRLLFREADPLGNPGRYGVLDTVGRRAPVTWWDVEPQGCHALWSADGRTVAMNSATGVTLYSADGRRPRPVPHLSGPSVWRSAHVASLSPDGSRIALTRTRPDEQTGDVGRLLTANAVLWTRDGREMSLPTGGRELRQVFFRPDGSAVLRVRAGAGHALLVVGRDGRKAGEVAEPAELRGMQIVSA
ncbi:TolB family protein [Micromonospora citrea]|uniref:TolB family protein n=1 Tax=Micromonospora citrea TaxID=47855 RepID=UPI003C547D1A